MLTFFLNAIVNVLLFALIPFVWWLCTARRRENFLRWLGFTKPILSNARLFAVHILAYAVITVLSQVLNGVLFDRSITATAQFTEFTITQVINVLIYGLVQTGLAEEILFRGFLTKRFCEKFGFALGNTLQALLFGLMHGVLFFIVGNVSLIVAIVLTVIPAMVGWWVGYVNEKLSGGSILPGYLMHGLGNVFVAFLSMSGLI